MPAIGITGGISTGKSTFCLCLREIIPAAKFFDADVAARSLPKLPEVKQEILGQFGREVFSPEGDLNRAKLRAIVFADAAKGARSNKFFTLGYVASGWRRRKGIVILLIFSLLTSHFFMKRVVKLCVSRLSWLPVRTKCS